MIGAALFLLATSPDPLVGRWEGTSLCQIKPSPCHDEHAVYHVSRLAPANYRWVMNKLVGGVEQEMGTLDFTFNAATGNLVGYNRDRAGQRHRWTFHLHGQHMSGRLAAPDGKLFRLIEIDKR